MTTTSGATSSTTNQDPEVVHKATTPSGTVAITEAEWNKTQAELRVLRKRAKESTEADPEREAREAARAKEIANAKAAQAAAEHRASVAELLAERGVTGPRAKLFKDLLAEPTEGETPAQAFERLAKEYDLPTTVEPPKPARKPAPKGPGNPSSFDAVISAMPLGYVSPEEYKATPIEIRHTAAFQARVRVSEPVWRRMSGNRISRITGEG